MGAESLLRFRRVSMPHAAVWISLVVLLVALGLLVSAVRLGLTSSNPSPGNESLLMGPFRWSPGQETSG